MCLPVQDVKSGTHVHLKPFCMQLEVTFILCMSILENVLDFIGLILCSFSYQGKLTDMHGNAYRYDANVKHMNSAGVLATLKNHEYYLSRVPQAVLQALPSN